jgi:hypothetical protein
LNANPKDLRFANGVDEIEDIIQLEDPKLVDKIQNIDDKAP